MNDITLDCKKSNEQSPCLGCENKDGKCLLLIYPAHFRGPLDSEDLVSIKCHYAHEFLINYPDQKEISVLSKKYWDENKDSNYMIKVYKELKQAV